MRLNPSKIKIIRLFIDSPKEEFYLSQVSKSTGVSLDRTHAYLKFWVEKKALIYKTLGRMKLYKLNDSRFTRSLIRFLEVLDE